MDSLSDQEKKEILKVATSAAIQGGKIAIKYFRKLTKVQEKDGAGLVSEADRESELKIRQVVWKAFPRHRFLGEESGYSHPVVDSNYLWVVDPLDGTTNYVHGFPFFCVSIGLEYKGDVQVGVVHAPLLNSTFTAAKGLGAFENGKKISVSKTKLLENSLLATGFSYKKRSLLNQELKDFRHVAQVSRGVRRAGSAALDFCMVAKGVFDGFWERDLSSWDVAAGSLIVKEAGGRVTDFKGNPFKIEMKTVLAGNPPIHKLLLTTLKKRK